MKYKTIISNKLGGVYLVSIPETAIDNQMSDWDIIILEQQDKINETEKAIQEINNQNQEIYKQVKERDRIIAEKDKEIDKLKTDKTERDFLILKKDENIERLKSSLLDVAQKYFEQITALQDMLRKVNYRLGELEDYEFHEEIEQHLK